MDQQRQPEADVEAGPAVNYYERHLGDYARDTAHLSLLEHGVYTLLLDRYYVTEKPLPNDERELFRLLRAASKAEKDAVRQVLREFFTETDEGWRQNRCDEVIADFNVGQPQREAKRANEKARQQRHRDERARMFEQLRAVGITPGWNVTTERLRELVTRNCDGTSHDLSRVTVTAPATPATATHSHFPLPTSQSPPPNPQTQTPEAVSNLLPSGRVSADSAREIPRAPEGRTLTNAEHWKGWEPVKAAYPPVSGAVDWITAERNCRRLVEAGTATWADLLAVAERYAAFVANGGIGNPRCVTFPAKFFDPDNLAKPWAADWTPPAKPDAAPYRRRKTADELEAEERARASA